VFSSVLDGLRWFIDGLVDGWTALGSRTRGKSRVALVSTDDGFRLETPDGTDAPELLRIEEAAGGYQFAPVTLAARLKKRDVDLVPPADEIVVRTLDPLPGESRQFLDSIVQHQLERLAPWRAEEVLHTYRVVPDERANDRIVVTVFATARAFSAQAVQALRPFDPREVRLLYPEPWNGEEVAIPVDRGEAAAARATRIRRGAVALVSVLAAIILLGGAAVGWGLHRADEKLDVLSRAIAEQRRALMAAQKTAPASQSEAKAMVDRRQGTPFLVLSLEALAATLPDDTWLSEVRIAEGRVRMTGTSRNVPGLVPLIEGSHAFAEPTFYAPTTRLPNGEGDRFHLEARLLPHKGSKP